MTKAEKFLANIDCEPCFWSSDDVPSLIAHVKQRITTEYEGADAIWKWEQIDNKAGAVRDITEAAAVELITNGSTEIRLCSIFDGDALGPVVDFTTPEECGVGKYVEDPQFGRMPTAATNCSIIPIGSNA